MIRILKDVYRYRDLIAELVTTDLKQRYRRSYLGILWSVLNPLLLGAALWIVFTHLRPSSDGDDFALYLLSGLIVFTFFQQGTTSGMSGVIRYRSISENIPVPRHIGPIAVVTANLVNFAFMVLAYLAIAALLGRGLMATTLLIFPVALMAYVMTAGLALLLAATFVFFRDLQHLVGIVFRALFFLTPIFYDIERLGPQVAAVLKFNPAYYLVIASRAVLYEGAVPSVEIWVVGFGMALALLAVGSAVFQALEHRFVYHF